MNVRVIFHIRLNGVAVVFKENRQTKSYFTITVDFIIRAPVSQLYIKKTVGVKVTTSRIGREQCCQYKYSTKERTDIGKYSTEVLWLPYLLYMPLRQHTHIKITLSYKFKHI